MIVSTHDGQLKRYEQVRLSDKPTQLDKKLGDRSTCLISYVVGMVVWGETNQGSRINSIKTNAVGAFVDH